jgi:hypothetical protein
MKVRENIREKERERERDQNVLKQEFGLFSET